MNWIEVDDFDARTGWASAAPDDVCARHYCRELESGRVLFFQSPPFDLPDDDQHFLVVQDQADSRLHKNISYRPANGELRGFASATETHARQMHSIMRRYSQAVTNFLSRFLLPYAAHWSLDYASFRPFEEDGRDLPLHKRNDLLHVDAFPSRPVGGNRILRVFTNVNPTHARVWLTTNNFADLAARFAARAGLTTIAGRAASPAYIARRKLVRGLRRAGLPLADRSPYDDFMLRFHDFLKESSDFQEHTPKIRMDFPPLSTWMVFTDAVPHAVLSGRAALEQTFIVPFEAMLDPKQAPISVLENLCGHRLSN